MNNKQLEKYLRNRILVEIKANSLRKRLTEEQIGEIAVYLASDDNLLTEGFFSTIGALLGGSMTETKRFLAKRVVSFLGIPSGHPLSQPVTDFIARLPTKDIYAMYRGNPRMRKKLVSVLSDATVNAFKQEMPNIMALKGGSLGGPITDAMTDVVSTKEFKQSVQKSLEDALINLPGSDAGDLQSIRQDIEDLKAGVSDIQQSLKKQVSTDTAPVEAPSEMPVSTKAKVKRRTTVVPPAEVPAAAAEEPAVLPPAPAAEDPTAVEEPAADPTAAEEPTAEDPTAVEEPATKLELTTEEKLKEVQEFVKRFTPGGSLGVYRDPSAEGIKRGWIAWVRIFRKHKDGENKGKVMNWEGVNKIYKAFAAATSDDDKIEALYKSKFIKDAGYEAIQANRSGTPESDLESAKGTGDAEKIAGAAAATVVDGSVDDSAREEAEETLEKAIDDAPVSEEPPPAEEDLADVEELSAGVEEPAEADEQRFPELEDENRHYDLARALPGEEPQFGNIAFTPESALDHINTALKFDSQADKLEFFVKALKKNPDGEGYLQTTGEVVPVEEHPDFKGKLIRPEPKEPEAAEETPEPDEVPPEAPEPETTQEPETVEQPEKEAEAAVQDTEADAADAKADDLERAAENEPANKELQKQATSARAEADRERAEADRAAARTAEKEAQRKERLASVSGGEGVSEATLPPKADRVRQAILKDVAKLDPDTNIELYKRGLNEFVKKVMNSIVEEAEESEAKRTKKSKAKESADDYIDKKIEQLYVEKLNSVRSNIKRNNSTSGMGGVFNFMGDDGKVVEVVPTSVAAAPEEAPEEAKTGYKQINVELYDDKTVVLSDRSTRGKIKRSKIGEGMLSELEWSAKASKGSGPTTFRREGVSVVELPPVSLDKFPKIDGWGTATSEQKKALTDEIYNLLKQKSESDPEAVEDFDLGSDEETGKPNIVIMGLSIPAGERDKWSGVFDHRSYKSVVEDIPRDLVAFYKDLKNRYIYSEDVMDPNNKKVVKHKKGEYDGDRAFSATGPMDLKWAFGINTYRGKEIDHTKMLNGKKLLRLAEFLGIDEKDLVYLPYLILVKTGDIQPEPDKAPEPKPQSAAPDIDPDELADMEDAFEKSLEGGGEEEEEVEGLEEIFNVSEDQLRRLLS